MGRLASFCISEGKQETKSQQMSVKLIYGQEQLFYNNRSNDDFYKKDASKINGVHGEFRRTFPRVAAAANTRIL